MEQVGIEHLSVFGLPPVEFVTLAADLGCRSVATALTPFRFNPHGYRAWSLRDDAALRREMIAAMRDLGVSISLGEGFMVGPGRDIRDRAEDLHLMAELGARRINTVSLDPDASRTFDQFGTLTDMAAEYGIETTVELVPGLTVGTLEVAMDAIRAVDRQTFRLLIDAMHLVRSGATVADVAALDPAVIGHVQLCDVPLTPTNPDYTDEAMYQRMVPGDGELPLFDLLTVLPPDVGLGLEVPLRAEAEAGSDPHVRLGRCVEATRTLLSRLEG